MHLPDPTLHAFRLRPGEDLREAIQHYAETHSIEAGWIVTCVGSLTEYHLRFADQDGGDGKRGPVEIVSLVGTVSIHGSHLHMSVADKHGRTTGGHLLEGNPVYTTAEIVIGESRDVRFVREVDATTGYRELVVRPKE